MAKVESDLAPDAHVGGGRGRASSELPRFSASTRGSRLEGVVRRAAGRPCLAGPGRLRDSWRSV